MAFFVPDSKKEPETSSHNDDNLEIRLLVLGKRSNLSFAEINELRTSDLLEFARIFAGTEDDKPKEATQDDIDAFYGR